MQAFIPGTAMQAFRRRLRGRPAWSRMALSAGCLGWPSEYAGFSTSAPRGFGGPGRRARRSRTILFNKPYGVLSQFTPKASSRWDCLASFIDYPGVYPAGRLDGDSEGQSGGACCGGNLRGKCPDGWTARAAAAH